MDNRFETFTMLLNRISRSIRRIKVQEMAEFGLRSAHVSCLYYLHQAGSLTATELCERCEEDKAAVSRALEHLEQSGYLTCESRSAKRYKSPIVLTDKGREVGRQIAEKIDHVLEEISGGLTEEERIAFYRSLSIISSSLEAIAGGGDEDS